MKYPTRDGLAISPYELNYTIPEKIGRGLTQNHHLYFPRTDYSTWRAIFRNMIQNVYPMLSREHSGIDSLHDVYSAPKMPHDSLMIDIIEHELAINGVLSLVHEKRTNDIYEISEEQWEFAKRKYDGA